MAVVGAFAAKTHLSRLLARVAKGERITITKNGAPVALLVPVEHGRRQRHVDDVIHELETFRKGRRLRGVSVREMIDEGRR